MFPVNAALHACGGVSAGMPSAVLSVWMGPENKYSFVEMCSADTAAVAMGLTGINYLGVSLKISRPKSYTETSLTSAASGVLASALSGLAAANLGYPTM